MTLIMIQKLSISSFFQLSYNNGDGREATMDGDKDKLLTQTKE